MIQRRPPVVQAIIVAAGTGTRTGRALPKQFADLAGRPMIAYSHAALAGHPAIAGVLCVIGEGQQALLTDALGDVPHVLGGANRRQSVANGLAAIAASGGADVVLVHDAARPFLSAQVIDRLVAALDDAAGAIPVLSVADTLARGQAGVLGDIVPRDGLYRVQTPQAFRFDLLTAAHATWPADREATDDAQMVRAIGHRVALVAGDPQLEKITFAEDFDRMNPTSPPAPSWVSRSASGFDVHRLAAGEELWLGGVRIPHHKGLAGHSDADVALHAITDALLGTIAAGDIGTHFPPSDPQWRGAESAQFLTHAAGLVAAQGGIIDFIDLTLICEAPKIGPHRDAMRERIAGLLRLGTGQVSIKATTTERLGFTGRGEGIAAQAIATIRLPAEKVA
ncbi:bifunctional 2-C-methyl-D-erythritol 4-phosphate cytidylyltransferase/2-C-methyl-D-erythritol 2,4-cyclodiphosphate synthase [Sphingomonas sp. SFZ2018-12]|uniref:bifunctional 2-C-methyl-D-erythritol 4-phosphate cytidylyltransferase/2-C-methyl-D-erythritol 2,4-cyclodiphosphate synthase n=3 Tax=unclassified Sphingomonas TaxID=196159 RepID=UPI001F0FFCA7|nr:bifunctional 2-C-methyl-D-erythritol 4-phosphate cytidylyltransferase/2-C-methyl-D-erythritol 2,4-cyclodiphosphate synthase [Sphingomonas sp. SFZ2018-12]MCH4892867.1 bifunctional 2-C-methyl-D-erythritol 4-phosphate cytidylyltransferase/2-C-methyl-D-erythritol 2,4-cyclodiphosphate synthase [Sphingomonas sp. SFZ2018-12]